MEAAAAQTGNCRAAELSAPAEAPTDYCAISCERKVSLSSHGMANVISNSIVALFDALFVDFGTWSSERSCVIYRFRMP